MDGGRRWTDGGPRGDLLSLAISLMAPRHIKDLSFHFRIRWPFRVTCYVDQIAQRSLSLDLLF